MTRARHVRVQARVVRGRSHGLPAGLLVVALVACSRAAIPTRCWRRSRPRPRSNGGRSRRSPPCRRDGKLRPAVRVLVIDNYDSFTFNLVQYLGELGATSHVVKNDGIDAAGVAASE